jgi:hypothetical protein
MISFVPNKPNIILKQSYLKNSLPILTVDAKFMWIPKAMMMMLNCCHVHVVDAQD